MVSEFDWAAGGGSWDTGIISIELYAYLQLHNQQSLDYQRCSMFSAFLSLFQCFYTLKEALLF